MRKAAFPIGVVLALAAAGCPGAVVDFPPDVAPADAAVADAAVPDAAVPDAAVPDALVDASTGCTFTGFTDRAQFIAAAGPLTLEDFSVPTIPAGDNRSCGPFLSSLTDAACAKPGQIVGGVTIRSHANRFGMSASTVAIYGKNWLQGPANTTQVVGPEVSEAGLEVSFDAPVRWVGMDALPDLGEAGRTVDTMSGVETSFYNAAGVLLGTVTGPPGRPIFTGATCGAAVISRMTIDEATLGHYMFAGNLAFAH